MKETIRYEDGSESSAHTCPLLFLLNQCNENDQTWLFMHQHSLG